MLGEIEHCMTEAREFYCRILAMQSPHAFRQVNKLLQSLEEAGYGDFQAVKDFRNELRQAQTPHRGGKQLVEKDP